VALYILTSGLLSSIAHAQINSWTNPSRGFWDDAESWSLGVRPANSQSVFITNVPSKTVTIDSYTSGMYLESLTISNLNVSAPDGSTNTLFLNNAGLTTPLSVLGTLDIQANGDASKGVNALQFTTAQKCGSHGGWRDRFEWSFPVRSIT